MLQNRHQVNTNHKFTTTRKLTWGLVKFSETRSWEGLRDVPPHLVLSVSWIVHLWLRVGNRFDMAGNCYLPDFHDLPVFIIDYIDGLVQDCSISIANAVIHLIIDIWFRTKLCPNALARLAVLLAPGRLAEEYVESCNSQKRNHLAT